MALMLSTACRATDRPGMIAGPVLINARYPLDLQGLETCCAAFTLTVDTYVEWMKNADQVAWVTTRILYDRDCQVRLKLFQKAAAEYGPDLAGADAGEMGMVGHNRLGLGRQD